MENRVQIDTNHGQCLPPPPWHIGEIEERLLHKADTIML